MTTKIRIVSSTVYVTCGKHIQTKINKAGLHLELELLKRFEAVQMEIELHICSFQNPFSLFFLFLTVCLRIPFLFILTASFIREKPMPIFFP